MALESAQYVNQLNSSNPLSTDTVSQADDHLRLIKQVLVNTFPNLNAPVTATAAQMNTPVPTGLIAMWSGAVNAVPSGWRLCDGTNGTPDLRNRFIVGAGDTYAVGNTGGSNSVTLNEDQMPSHTHAITATIGASGSHTHAITDPGHSHTYTSPGGTGTIAGGFGISAIGAVTGANTTGISVNSAGNHTHSIIATAATAGLTQSHENRPPYYALAYIMKA